MSIKARVTLVAILAAAVDTAAAAEQLIATPTGRASAASATLDHATQARRARIWFARRPRWRRRGATGLFGIPRYLASEATIAVADADARPRAGVPVVFVASAGEAKCSAEAVTDDSGTAQASCSFDGPLPSLDVSFLAWVDGETDIVTDTVRTRIRDVFEADVSIDYGMLVARDNDVVDLTNSVLIRPRVQINAWDTADLRNYWRASVYGTVPGIGQNRLLFYQFPDLTQSSKAGVGDLVVGGQLSVRQFLALDVGFNSRTGTLNLIDSVRNLGRPTLINLADGLESVDGTLLLTGWLGAKAFAFSATTGSHPLPRTFPEQQRFGFAPFVERLIVERKDSWQAVGGFGFIGRNDTALTRVWAGYLSDPGMRVAELRTATGAINQLQLQRYNTADPPLNVVVPRAQQWLVGVTFESMRLARTDGASGLVVGWTRDRRVFLTWSTSLILRIL